MEESSANIIKKSQKIIDTIIKSGYGRCNRLACVAVVDVGMFYLFFKVELHTIIKSFSWVFWRISSKKSKKSAYYNQVKLWLIQSCCSWQFINVRSFFFFLLAGNPYFKQVVFCRSLEWPSPKKVRSAYYIQRKLWSRQSFFFMAGVDVGKFLYFLLAGNPDLNQVVFTLWWILSSKKNEKSYAIIKSNYRRYTRIVHDSSEMLAIFCLFYWLEGRTLIKSFFCRRPRRVPLQNRQTWILLSSRVTADTIVLLMSQLLLLASFIPWYAFLAWNPHFNQVVFLRIVERISKKSKKKLCYNQV